MVRLCCFNTSRNVREGSSPRLNRGVSFYKDVADALGSTKTDDGGHTKVTIPDIMFRTTWQQLYFCWIQRLWFFFDSNMYIFFVSNIYIFFHHCIFFPGPLCYFFGHFYPSPPSKNGEKDVDSSPLLQQRQSMYGMTKGAKTELASGYSVTDRLIHQSSNLPVRDIRRCCTCWWYSWCNLKYWWYK